MGFLRYRLDDQCLARRPNPGEGKPTSRSSFLLGLGAYRVHVLTFSSGTLSVLSVSV